MLYNLSLHCSLAHCSLLCQLTDITYINDLLCNSDKLFTLWICLVLKPLYFHFICLVCKWSVVQHWRGWNPSHSWGHLSPALRLSWPSTSRWEHPLSLWSIWRKSLPAIPPLRTRNRPWWQRICNGPEQRAEQPRPDRVCDLGPKGHNSVVALSQWQPRDNGRWDDNRTDNARWQQHRDPVWSYWSCLLGWEGMQLDFKPEGAAIHCEQKNEPLCFS